MIPTSIIIPAWNEAQRIAVTLKALRHCAMANRYDWELVVVNDGSEDDTERLALPWADKVITHSANLGKGAALQSGWKQAEQDCIMFLDADLGISAAYASELLMPIVREECDMAIAKLPAPRRKAGIGLVKSFAVHGIYYLSGYSASAPLSGQRALRKEVLRSIQPLSSGFGIEVGLTIDAARQGYRIAEVEVPFAHRETGRSFRDFYHRGKQFVSVGRTFYIKWKNV